MQWLLLGSNRLTELPDRVFDNLAELQWLPLSRNRLTELPDRIFDSLAQLQDLYLDSNQLTELPDRVFDNLVDLQSLSLRSNRLTELPDRVFDNLAGLQGLSLSSNQLTELPDRIFDNLTQLKDLSLDSNQLTELPDRLFYGMGNLSWYGLRLHDNPGSPFKLMIDLRRTGPATIRAEIAKGAPFDVTVGLVAAGGTLSADRVEIPAGAWTSVAVTVTPDSSSASGMSINVSGFWSSPEEYQGISLLRGDPLVLANPDSLAVSIQELYLTQGIQNLEGKVPVVAGQNALLRVFGVSNLENDFRPIARATFYQRNGQVQHVDMEPPSAGIPIDVDESRLALSFNAEIPGSLLQPGTQMVVELDPKRVLPVTDGSQTRFPGSGRLTLNVRKVPATNFTIVPVQYARDANAATNSTVLDFARSIAGDKTRGPVRYVRNVLPVGDLAVTLREPYFTWADTSTAGAYALLGEIELLRHTEAGRATEHYQGLIARPASSKLPQAWSATSVAYQPGQSALTLSHEADGRPNANFAQDFAHGLGHNFSLRHSPCGTEVDIDPNYPRGDGAIRQYGLDFGDPGKPARVLDPYSTMDLMSYCNPRWISTYSFTKALDYRLEGASASPPARQVLLLWGGIEDGNLRLEPAFVWNAPVKLPVVPGRYRLSGTDASGQRLFSFSFAPAEIGRDSGGFLFAVPFETSWIQEMDRIVLSGPEGSTGLDRASAKQAVLLTDRATARIRSIVRDWTGTVPPVLGSAATLDTKPALLTPR